MFPPYKKWGLHPYLTTPLTISSVIIVGLILLPVL